VRTITKGSEDIDIFLLWDDCPFVSDDQEWVESVAMGFTDSHESAEEDVSFTAPSDGSIFIAVRCYDAGEGHSEISTWTLSTTCDGKKSLCEAMWPSV